MPLREIAGRAADAASKRLERFAYYRGRFDWADQTWARRLCHNAPSTPSCPDDMAEWWLDHMDSRQEPPFLLDESTLVGARSTYQEYFRENLDSLVKTAKQSCRGEFSFLGINAHLRDPIDWQRDPVSGSCWPRDYYGDLHVPFCDGLGSLGAAGDSKHVWELNRHEFLIDCGKAFFLTGQERYAKRVEQVVADWIAGNRYLQGINWAGPLEAAVRSMAWLWAYQFCRSWQGKDAHRHLEWIKSFYQHGLYLNRHIEIYSSPNNHLVGEATALYLLGSFFPEFDEARAWRAKAWIILQNETQRQFYDDGGSTEQSTSYHHYCLGFFFLVLLLRRRQNASTPSSMDATLKAACEFSMWMTTPDGSVPHIGDTDDARSIRFSATRHWDFRNQLSIAAVIFSDPTFKAVAGACSEDVLWLTGAEGVHAYEELVAQLPSGSTRCFSTSGYAILRSGWTAGDHHTCFDSGEIGHNLSSREVPLFTHGHADALALTTHAFGRPLLVDSGFYTYNGSPAWHRYTRESSGHNTVTVDGKSPARFHPKNAWSCAAKTGRLEHESHGASQIVIGSHSGFYGVPNCQGHKRAVVIHEGRHWIIFDRIGGAGRRQIEVFFHFAPGNVELLESGCGATFRSESGIYASLLAAECTDLEASAMCGGSEPAGGWIAASYGRKVAAPVVRFSGCVQLPYRMAFLLSASTDLVEFPEFMRTGSHGDKATESAIVSWASTDHAYQFTFNWTAPVQFRVEKVPAALHRGSKTTRKAVSQNQQAADCCA